MKRTVIIMSVIALLLVLVAQHQGGGDLVLQGFQASWSMLFPIFPVLAAAFLAAGLISELISPELIKQWLGRNAGWKGPLFGTLAGALVPGGPFFFYPLIATLYVSGASGGTVMSFIAAKTLWSVSRLPLEIALVGLELTLIRVAITFAFPMLAGLLVNGLFSSWSEKIRGDVEQLQKRRAGGRDD